MTLLIATAATTANQGSSINAIIMLVLMVAIFYFMILRPNQKHQKKHRELMDALTVGTEVVMSGGLVGQITSLHENFVRLQVADGIDIIMQRASVVAILPKDTIKNINSESAN